MFLMPLRDVLRCAIFDTKEKCIRHDVLIRIIGAKDLVADKAQPHFLYTKLSWERTDSLPMLPGQTERIYPDSNLRMIELFGSMRTRGFTHNFPIILDRNFKLVEGAHRLAVAYALGIDPIPVCITNKAASIEDLRWFETRFSKFEWAQIEAQRSEILVFIAGVPAVHSTPDILPTAATMPPAAVIPIAAPPVKAEPPKAATPPAPIAPPVGPPAAAIVQPGATQTPSVAIVAPVVIQTTPPKADEKKK